MENKLRIFFRGLCIFVKKSNGKVRVLLPDAGNGRSPYDSTNPVYNTPTFPHIPQLTFNKNYLKTPPRLPNYPNNFYDSNLRFFYLDDDNNEYISWPFLGDIISIRKAGSLIGGDFAINDHFYRYVKDINALHSTSSIKPTLLNANIDNSLAAYVDLNVGELTIPETDPEIEPDEALRAKLVPTSFDPNPTNTDFEFLTDTVCWEITIPKNNSDDYYDFQLNIENKGVVFNFRLPGRDDPKPINIYVSNMPPTRYMLLRENFELFPDRDFELVYKVLDVLPTHPPKLPRRIPREDEDHSWPPIMCSLAWILQ
ncbi:MAG: hypothetical protein J0M03_21185 [Acidobacteria bacterium]|nr:hypothetical protein [Acidobacteriota bacterium]